MIPNPKSNKLAPISRCYIQAVGLRFVPKLLSLQFYYRTNGLSHGIAHLLDRVLLFPALLPFPVCEVRDIKRSKVL